MKTSKIKIYNVKDTDGWFNLMNDLSTKENITEKESEEIYKKTTEIFEYGEFGNFEIEVDENLNIVGGRIIPFKEI